MATAKKSEKRRTYREKEQTNYKQVEGRGEVRGGEKVRGKKKTGGGNTKKGGRI